MTTLGDLIDRRRRLQPEIAADGIRWLADVNPAAAIEARGELERAAERYDPDAIAVLMLLDAPARSGAAQSV